MVTMQHRLFFPPIIIVKSKCSLWMFLVRPGDGETVFYSPAGVNATLHCTVNNTNIFWSISIHGNVYTGLSPELHPRGIFFSTSVPYRGVTMSYIRIFGNRVLNNNISICCQSLVRNALRNACTTLIIYGREINAIFRNVFIFC